MYQFDARARLILLSVATLVLAVLATARRLDSLPEGLVATDFPDAGWSTTPLPLRIDPRPSTDSLAGAWHGHPPPAFSATWVGSFVTVRPGSYTFATASDDGSWVYVDGRLVVDNAGRHEAQQSVGAIDLDRGVHELFVKYFQDGGEFSFRLLWARGAAPLVPIPARDLFPRRAEFSRLIASVALRRAVPLALWFWIGTLVIVAGASLRRPVVGAVERLRADRNRAALALIVAASVVVNLIGIWWGLPSYWAGDEISPTGVLTALAQHFSNGWFDRYPPFQFHVLSVVFSPWLVATSLGWIHASDQVHLVTLIVLSRLVSVAAGAGTLAAIYVCGARVFNKRAGLLGAAMMALVPPFVFYAKTANPEVPYLFWFALSLVFCVRWLRTFAFRDIALFALTATLAVCTKDQAYALYLAMPFVMVSALWQRHRAAQSPRALARALADARLWAGAAVAAAVFVLIHNIAFDPGGFVHHVRDITGPGSQGYRMVEPTLAGRLALLRLTLDLSQRSWGWPLFLVSLAGVIVALREAEGRRASICLALVIVSYYVGFIDVILYDYDRYLLPVCVVQAIFGGAALDRFLQSRRFSQPLRIGLVTAAFAYTVLYAATVDDLMVRDSRYTVERWLDGRVGPDEQIGTAFPVIVLPRLGRFHTIDIGTLDNLRKWAPAYYVLNADYARAVPPETPLGRLIAALQEQQAGYRLMLRYHSPSLWPWLPAPDPDLLGPRLETPSLSFLRDINPTIEVYERKSR